MPVLEMCSSPSVSLSAPLTMLLLLDAAFQIAAQTATPP